MGVLEAGLRGQHGCQGCQDPILRWQHSDDLNSSYSTLSYILRRVLTTPWMLLLWPSRLRVLQDEAWIVLRLYAYIKGTTLFHRHSTGVRHRDHLRHAFRHLYIEYLKFINRLKLRWLWIFLNSHLAVYLLISTVWCLISIVYDHLWPHPSLARWWSMSWWVYPSIYHKLTLYIHHLSHSLSLFPSLPATSFLRQSRSSRMIIPHIRIAKCLTHLSPMSQSTRWSSRGQMTWCDTPFVSITQASLTRLLEHSAGRRVLGIWRDVMIQPRPLLSPRLFHVRYLIHTISQSHLAQLRPCPLERLSRR